jgi:hypothetical protein
VAAFDSLDSILVHDSYGFRWDRNGEMLIRYRAVVVDGQLHICGAYSNRGGSSITRLGRQVLREATITMDGSSVLRNLQFFNVVSNANNSNGLVGTTASCVNTELTPTKAQVSTIEINIRSGRYRTP